MEGAARLLEVVVVEAAVDLLAGRALVVVFAGAEKGRLPILQVHLVVVLDVGVLDRHDGQVVDGLGPRAGLAVVPAEGGAVAGVGRQLDEEADLGLAPLDDQPDEVARLVAAERLGHAVGAVDGAVVDPDDHVAGLDAGGRGRHSRRHLIDVGAVGVAGGHAHAHDGPPAADHRPAHRGQRHAGFDLGVLADDDDLDGIAGRLADQEVAHGGGAGDGLAVQLGQDVAGRQAGPGRGRTGVHLGDDGPAVLVGVEVDAEVGRLRRLGGGLADVRGDGRIDGAELGQVGLRRRGRFGAGREARPRGGRPAGPDGAASGGSWVRLPGVEGGGPAGVPGE